ncbi:LytTR family DNA-binding domain-containing protein [Echinicola sp. 20G]|uniref:LytTR family DNA-binding domain-containing protein n=1 Tax=Echinicola sp. 20G TaxID=2781961 RepID=UPI001910F81E|nr:LytTR family transcriptional regulator DNA-binding domain-containing protein [Echinicola sp. 20G]
MKNILKYHPSYNKKWGLTILTGLFLFFVLYFYEGFGIEQGLSFSGHNLFIRALIFGLFTSLSFYIHEFLLSKFLVPKNNIQNVFWALLEIFMGANVTFLLFNYFWNWTEWFWNAYFLLLGEYSSVMLIPVIMVWLWGKTQRKIEAAHHMLTFKSENGKHQLKLKEENLLFIKSEDNYVEIHYLSNHKVKHELLRNTLKRIQEQNPTFHYLIKCHRSYLVNYQNIQQTQLAKSRMLLDLGHDLFIPVSPKYIESITKLTDQ